MGLNEKNVTSIVHKMKHEEGIYFPGSQIYRGKNSLDTEEMEYRKKVVKEKLEEGMLKQDIAKILGVSPGIISRLIKQI